MNAMLGAFAAVVAFACVFAMGFAIQRGGTCTVAAVDEIVSSRRAHRLAAMLEASLWVAGGLLVAQALHRLPMMPAGYAVSSWTVLGGALLGLGAWVCGACVFGAVARFGSGQWAYALAPLGFYLGCVTVGSVFPAATASRLAAPSPLLQAGDLAAVAFAGFVVWRLLRARPALRDGQGGLAGLPRRVGEKVWSPHAATIVIGITFVLTWLLAGRWAYTELLYDVAHGMAASVGVRIALFGALLLGLVYGGWTAGRFAHTPVTPTQLGRALVGGVMMGWGTLLIPGANDGLVLIGLPLLRPYAWLAFATMVASIGLALLAARALGPLRGARVLTFRSRPALPRDRFLE
ncbi:MAG: YeeE/YedE thiosulfate transporter family protein [Rhizobacter sp.]